MTSLPRSPHPGAWGWPLTRVGTWHCLVLLEEGRRGWKLPKGAPSPPCTPSSSQKHPEVDRAGSCVYRSFPWNLTKAIITSSSEQWASQKSKEMDPQSPGPGLSTFPCGSCRLHILPYPSFERRQGRRLGLGVGCSDEPGWVQALPVLRWTPSALSLGDPIHTGRSQTLRPGRFLPAQTSFDLIPSKRDLGPSKNKNKKRTQCICGLSAWRPHDRPPRASAPPILGSWFHPEARARPCGFSSFHPGLDDKMTKNTELPQARHPADALPWVSRVPCEVCFGGGGPGPAPRGGFDARQPHASPSMWQVWGGGLCCIASRSAAGWTWPVRSSWTSASTSGRWG